LELFFIEEKPMKRIVGVSVASLFSLQLMAQEVPTAGTPAPEAPKAEAPKPETPKAETSTAVKMRVRVDSLSQSVEVKPVSGSSTTRKMSGLRIKKADLTLVNKVGDATIQLRLNPIKDDWKAETTSSDTALPNVVEQFWLEMPLATGLSLRAGKLEGYLAGAYENMVDSSYDYYLKSYYAGKVIPASPLGMDLIYKLGAHQVRLQIANGLETEKGAAGEIDYTADGGMSTSVGYFGDFGMIKPLATYSMMRYSQDNHVVTTSSGDITHDHGGKGRTLFGIGALADIAGAALSAEYNMGKVDAYDFTLGGGKNSVKEQELTNVTAQVKYPIGPVTPFAKLTMDTHKLNGTNGNGDIERLGYSLGGSYNILKNARFDVVYNNIAQDTQKAATASTPKGTETVTTTEFIVAAALKI
jgi:hypothetical protein